MVCPLKTGDFGHRQLARTATDILATNEYIHKKF